MKMIIMARRDQQAIQEGVWMVRDQISAGRAATIEQIHGGVGGGESRNNQRVKEEVVGR